MYLPYFGSAFNIIIYLCKDRKEFFDTFLFSGYENKKKINGGLINLVYLTLFN